MEKSSKAKFFIIFLLIMAAGTGAYFYLPKSGFADQARAFVELALNGTRQQVRGFIDDKILPKDPEDQRKNLINELKNNLSELKSKISANNSATIKDSKATSTIIATTSGSTSINNLINDSQNIINQLEVANQNKTITQNAAERILDIILPIKEKAIGCVK
jgi:hypothetical protein